MTRSCLLHNMRIEAQPVELCLLLTRKQDSVVAWNLDSAKRAAFIGKTLKTTRFYER